MQQNMNSTAEAGMGIAVFGIFVLIAIAVYVFYCFCLKRICEKCGTEPGILIWIPIVQIVPLLQAGGLPVWMIILFLVPIVGFIMSIYMWVKICGARGKGALTVIGVILLPFIFIPYLAFSE